MDVYQSKILVNRSVLTSDQLSLSAEFLSLETIRFNNIYSALKNNVSVIMITFVKNILGTTN